MALLLALGVVIAFFDRINLSVSQNALHVSFGLSLIAFGYLSSAFSWTYAAMQMPAGVLLDRLGVKAHRPGGNIHLESGVVCRRAVSGPEDFYCRAIPAWRS